MKYLKNFENKKIYKVGDYVLLNGEIFMSNKDTPAKIISEFDWGNDFEHMYDDGSISISDLSYFKRHLTPDEIKDFETKINTKKYNL